MIRDPRTYQITVLSLLLGYGVVFLDFGVTLGRAAAILAAALLTQYACSRIWNLPAFDPRSALISGMSLCLLLRTNLVLVAIATAALTIASKFIFRRRGKHIFNPSNFGLIAALALTGNAWISAGQWGSAAFFTFLVACLGGFVIHRSSRSDVTWAFIAAYVSILFGRALWLGDPLAIPLHQIQNGAFLLFAFFMISDPKTTPDARAGRILFAALVAAGAAFIQFGLYRTNGLLWSLVFFSTTVPVIDWLFPGKRYAWGQAGESRRLPHPRLAQGATHENDPGHRKPLPV
ncbi:MAG: RnfABCDGE type electron transport complex subunit D [Myxococcota bacterium]